MTPNTAYTGKKAPGYKGPLTYSSDLSTILGPPKSPGNYEHIVPSTLTYPDMLGGRGGKRLIS